MPPHLLAPLLSWMITQGLKYFLNRDKVAPENRPKLLYATGGMPSSHTAIVTALMTSLGFIEGLDSPSFAIAAALAVIVIHDALQVRRSSGEQGLALQGLLIKAGIKTLPHSALGHKPREVIVGGLVGFVTAIVLLYV